ncbi:MAG: response regulator [Nitrospirae bacterium]|nr:response regulator [Nitrospirota bacterium]
MEEAPAAAAKKRVLIIDDSVSVFTQLKKIFDDDGTFDVVGHAPNGAEGLKMYKAHQPDAVLLDIVMPVLDGLKALKMILDADKNARVVMISSVGAVGNKALQALQLGAKGVISKPFRGEEILKTVKEL